MHAVLFFFIAWTPFSPEICQYANIVCWQPCSADGHSPSHPDCYRRNGGHFFVLITKRRKLSVGNGYYHHALPDVPRGVGWPMS